MRMEWAGAGPVSTMEIGSRVDNLVQFIGESTAIDEVKSLASTIARRNCTVMVLGETGTGKEVVAKYLHGNSDRAGNPFIPVDCSALSDTLFESELFGHVKGAFTGAVRDSLGFIRAADGGTLFLDEIGELSLPLQAKLLRVIQERRVTPVGETRSYPVNVRIVCATHRDLLEMVRRGTFRQDLYFRLNVVVLNLPPLRERERDVIHLAEHFLDSQAELYEEARRALSPEAAEAMLGYSWPGNVRELANVIEHAHVLARGNTIGLSDLPPRLREPSNSSNSIGSDLRLEDVERRTIAEALRRTNHCKAAASRLLGINVQRLGRRIDALNIAIA